MKKEYGYPTLKVICKASAGNETAIMLFGGLF